MKKSIYPRLAFVGIKNNSKLYVPYFFACAALMMIFYIVDYLANSEFVQNQPGGTMLSGVMDIGWILLTVFSAIFLFYTNSFLLKRRKTEFGLYNILGMGKNNIMIILVFENGMIFIASFLLGVTLGVIFSKLFEIMLILVLGGNNSYDFKIYANVIVEEFCIFLALFGIILVNGMRQIRINSPIELFRSDNSGEKPTKTNRILAIVGTVLLISGYILANAAENWIWALLTAFCGAILVIAATYLLFVSGSSVVCGLLKKNKKYYYQTNHFVSVSQMEFRMKKNGAGLASICILATMALVSISSVSGLYFGFEQIMRQYYPRDISYMINSDDSELVERLTQTMQETASDCGAEPSNFVYYKFLTDYDYYRGKKLAKKSIEQETMTDKDYDGLTIVNFTLVPISRYNAVMNTELTVNKGEALVLKMPTDADGETYDFISVKGEFHSEDIYNTDGEFAETIKYCDEAYLKCVGTVDDFVVMEGRELTVENTGIADNPIHAYAFVNDDDFEEQYQRSLAMNGESETHSAIENEDGSVEYSTYTTISPTLYHYFGMDVNCDDDTMSEIADETYNRNRAYRDESEKFYTIDGKLYQNQSSAFIYGIYDERSEFYGRFSGIMFIGVLFCAVFIAATVMIMYYKQITEGYEDRTRYRILQKVGMTKSEIRSTINSQVLTMFLLPLLTAGVHTVFAFGLIVKLLKLFGNMNVWYLAIVALVCFLIYAAVYAFVYRVTSKIYFKIAAG